MNFAYLVFSASLRGPGFCFLPHLSRSVYQTREEGLRFAALPPPELDREGTLVFGNKIPFRLFGKAWLLALLLLAVASVSACGGGGGGGSSGGGGGGGSPASSAPAPVPVVGGGGSGDDLTDSAGIFFVGGKPRSIEFPDPQLPSYRAQAAVVDACAFTAPYALVDGDCVGDFFKTSKLEPQTSVDSSLVLLSGYQDGHAHDEPYARKSFGFVLNGRSGASISYTEADAPRGDGIYFSRFTHTITGEVIGGYSTDFPVSEALPHEYYTLRDRVGDNGLMLVSNIAVFLPHERAPGERLPPCATGETADATCEVWDTPRDPQRRLFCPRGRADPTSSNYCATSQLFQSWNRPVSLEANDLASGPHLLILPHDGRSWTLPNYIQGDDAPSVNAAAATGKVRWLSADNGFALSSSYSFASSDTELPILGFIGHRCTGVAQYCYIVPPAFTEKRGTPRTLPNGDDGNWVTGPPVGAAFSFLFFEQLWERLPEGTHIRDVIAIADSCTDARLKGTEPTERFGLGRLRFGCMIVKAMEKRHAEENPPPKNREPIFAEGEHARARAAEVAETAAALEAEILQSMLAAELGDVRLPGATPAHLGVAYGDLAGDYRPAQGIATSYTPNLPGFEHDLPLGGGFSLSLRESQEFGAAYRLARTRLSLTQRTTQHFFGGTGRRAFAYGETLNTRTAVSFDLSKVVRVSGWRTTATANAAGRLLESVKGTEQGVRVDAQLRAASQVHLSLFGQTARFEGGTLLFKSGDSFGIRKSAPHSEFGLAFSARF